MAATLIRNTSNEKKDYIKASVSVNTVKELKGKTFHTDKVVMYEKDEEGEPLVVTALHMVEDDAWYTSISTTIYDSINVILDAMEDELADGIAMTIVGHKSKNDREFLVADLA